MNEQILLPRTVRTLDRFGGASRCLLRLWENEGHLSPSEEDYLNRFEGQFPHWETRPGELDVGSLAVVARALGLGEEFKVTATTPRCSLRTAAATPCSSRWTRRSVRPTSARIRCCNLRCWSKSTKKVSGSGVRSRVARPMCCRERIVDRGTDVTPWHSSSTGLPLRRATDLWSTLYAKNQKVRREAF